MTLFAEPPASHSPIRTRCKVSVPLTTDLNIANLVLFEVSSKDLAHVIQLRLRNEVRSATSVRETRTSPFVLSDFLDFYTKFVNVDLAPKVREDLSVDGFLRRFDEHARLCLSFFIGLVAGYSLYYQPCILFTICVLMALS